jgi:ribosomal protein L1
VKFKKMTNEERENMTAIAKASLVSINTRRNALIHALLGNNEMLSDDILEMFPDLKNKVEQYRAVKAEQSIATECGGAAAVE